MPDRDAAPSAQVRFSLEGELFQAGEQFRRSKPRIPSRVDALRELVERGLQQLEEPRAA